MNAIHETSKSLDLPQSGALEIIALQRFCSLFVPTRISCHGMQRQEYVGMTVVFMLSVIARQECMCVKTNMAEIVLLCKQQ